MTAEPSIGDLRADIRDWRRGRATASVTDVLQDVYVAAFAVLMIGAMGTNVVVGFRREADDLCTAVGCVDARAVLPWLTVTATLAAVLAMARLLGPVFTTPAMGAWLLSTPVDRASLLRRRFVAVSAVAALAVLAVAVPASALAGLAVQVVVFSGAAVAVAGVGAVALAAVSQERGQPQSRWLLWLLLAVTWAGLLSLAVDESPTRLHLDVPATGSALVVLALLLVAAVPLAVVGWRGLAALRRRELEPGGNLSSGLSGALATLDLALAYDVVVAHTTRARAVVRSRRGGPRGPLALAWRDVVRLRRRPQPLLSLAAVVVAPYAVAQAGGGRLTALVAVLVGFVAGVPLCLALRVVSRTPSLARMFPTRSSVTRACTLVVPAVAMAVFGLACAPAFGTAMQTEAGLAVAIGLAVGAGSLTAVAWWMAARQVDYGAPAVSSPMGAIPPGMIAGALHGPDMVLLTSVPLLVSPTGAGVVFSVFVSAAVLAFVVFRR